MNIKKRYFEPMKKDCESTNYYLTWNKNKILMRIAKANEEDMESSNVNVISGKFIW